MNKEFEGIYAALVTPFENEGSINYEELGRLVEYLIDRGIDGYYVGGSTAETFLLSTLERKKVLEAVIEANNGRKKVICHVGAISTDAAMDFAKHAEIMGANAISAISPFYYKFGKDEITQYYIDIMSATSLPMFVYNFPNNSGFTLTDDVLSDLCKYSNLAGVKFTSSDMFFIERMKTNHPELTIWNGYDEMLASGLMAGADGGVGSTYNCMPELIRKIYDSFMSGDIKAAQEYQRRANSVIEVICKYGVFASIKTILGFEGLSFGGCRKPFEPMCNEGIAELKTIYEKYIAQK